MSERVQAIFEKKVRKVTSDYERGVGVKTIASKVGVSQPTVSKWLTQEGYKHRQRGRYPVAMKARARDLNLRGWTPGRISRLLDVPQNRIDEWLRLRENPILGGEKDPLKIKGGRKHKRDKARSKKHGRPKKETIPPSWPPRRHKCRKHWTAIEENYVLKLIREKIPIREIYKRMRASRKRQLYIWRKYGNKGRPPNFPPRKPPPYEPELPHLPPEEVARRRKEARELEEAGVKRLIALEEEAAKRQQLITERESEIGAQEQRLKDLEDRRKALATEYRDQTKRIKAIEAALEKRPKAEELPRRVMPGSYEDVELGLPIGSLIEPKKRGRMPKPKGFARFADNQRYFVVSNDWADLVDATPDELAVFANFLTRKKFPARVERHGDQPRAYFENTWPPEIEARWNKVVEQGLELIEKYAKRRKGLEKRDAYSPTIARYLATAYDAYRNPKLNQRQKEQARQKLAQIWRDAKFVERQIMIYGMAIAEPNGAPTTKGIERGFSAKVLLSREPTVVKHKLEERKQRTTKKIEEEKEEDEVAALLAGAKEKFALPEGEEE